MMSTCRRWYTIPVLLLVTTLSFLFPAAAAAPVADFGAQDSFTQGYAPFTVQFEDHSAGAASWLWSFGDGQTSTAQNPGHTYAAPGGYTVSLMVRDATGSQSNTMTKPHYIVVAADPMYPGTYTTITTPPTTTAYTGAVAVTSDPSGAMVSLDGNTQGITPITMYNLPTGTHTVLVHMKGYPDFEKTLTVEYQTTLNLNVDFVQTATTRPTTVYTTTVRTTAPQTTFATSAPAWTATAETTTEVAESAPAPSYDRQAGAIHIYCTGCTGLADNGKLVDSIQYQVYAVNLESGSESLRFFGEIKSSEEAVISNVEPGSYRVSVSPYNYRSQKKPAEVSADTVTDVRFEASSFVRAPGFAAATVLLALLGLAAVRRLR